MSGAQTLANIASQGADALPFVDPVSGDTFAAPMIWKQGPKLDYKSGETLADTTTRFNALFAAIGEWGGGRVKVGEYALDRLSLDADFELELDQDAVLDFSGATTAGHCLSLGNTTFVDLPALAADLVEGTYAATFVSAPAVAKGDWIVPHDPTPYGWLAEANGGRTYYQPGERLRVADIVGNVVTFDAPILHSYAYAGLKMYKPAVRRIRLAGGHFIGRVEESADNSLIVAQNIQNGYFSFLAKTAERAILDLRHAIDTDVVGVAATDYGPSVSLNYGISVMASHKVNIIRPNLRTRRHAVSITGGIIIAPIPNRYVYVKDAFLSGDSLAFDSHGAAEFIGIIDSVIEGGAVLGGDHTDIKGCLIRTLRAGTNAGVGISLRERRGMNVNIDKTDVYTATALAADQYVIDMAGPAAAQESGAVRVNARIVTQLAQQRLARVMGGAAVGKYLDVSVKLHVDAPTGTADGQCYFDTSTAAQAWRNAEVDLSGAIQLAATNPLNATALKHLSKIRTSSTAAQAINRAQEITFERGATITIPQTLLSMQAGSRLDGNGGKILFGYSDVSNTVNFTASDVRDVTIEVGAGQVIQRLLRFQVDYGRLLRSVVRSVDTTNNSNDTNDALIRAEGANFLCEDVTLENSNIGLMLIGNDPTVINLTCRRMQKGITGKDTGGLGISGAKIKGLRWLGTNANADQLPGQNAVGGTFRNFSMEDFEILPSLDRAYRATGEHGIYLSGLDNTVNGNIRVWAGTIWQAGQCAVKIKDHFAVHIRDIRSWYIPGATTPGDNEEAYRFERNIGVTGGALHSGSEPITGTGRGGYQHMHFTGCSGVRLLETSYAENCYAGGIKFDVDDVNPALPHLDHVIRVRHKNVGGPSVILADNIIVNDEILIYLDTDGCPGSPISIGAGITWGPNGKLRVIGTYKNCGAAPPVSTANVDLSAFVPAGVGAVMTLAASAVPVSTALGNTGAQVLKTILIPHLDIHDALEVYVLTTGPGSANNKTVSYTLGGATIMSITDTANARRSDQRIISNRGATNSQIASSASNVAGIGGGAAPVTTAVETKDGTTLVISATPASASEQITLEAYSVKLVRGLAA